MDKLKIYGKPSISTSNILSVGTYKVNVLATLIPNGLWPGPMPSYTWTYFNITIINPCTQPSPCIYTTITSSPTIMT